MEDRIRIVSDCDLLRQPNPDGERVTRLSAGTELLLLRDDDRYYYKVAYEGEPAFVPKVFSLRLQAEADDGSDGPAILAHTQPISTALPEAEHSATGIAPAIAPVAARPTQSSNWFLSALRIAGLTIGIGLAMAGVGMAFASPLVVTSPEQASSKAVALGIGGGAALLVGLGLVRLTYRPWLQFVLLVSAVTLVIGGVELLIFAIPYSHMSPLDVDQDRARLWLPVAGALLIATGAAALLFLVVRWMRDPLTRERWPNVARWAAVIYGTLLASSVPGGASFAAAGASGQPYVPTLEDAGLIGASLAIALVPGALLLFHGVTMKGQIGARPFRFVPAWALLALFAGALALGAVVVVVEEPVIWLMSAAHAGAALLPALALIALASRGGLGSSLPAAGLTHRQLWLAFAVGIAVVTMIAGTLDGVIVQALSVGLLAANGAFDGIPSSELGFVLRHTEFYLSRGQEIALLFLVVVTMAPVMEEGFKALGVSLLLPRKPTPSAALTLGVAVGAGFGVFEASVYGLGGLIEPSEVDWWALMLVRGGATSMHALNTGMLGLALYYGRAEGRYGRAFALYLAAVAMHALWNGLAVLAGTRVIFSFESLTDRELAALAFGVLAPLAIAVLTLLYAVSRHAYRASPKVAEEGATMPLAKLEPAFEPWLG